MVCIETWWLLSVEVCRYCLSKIIYFQEIVVPVKHSRMQQESEIWAKQWKTAQLFLQPLAGRGKSARRRIQWVNSVDVIVTCSSSAAYNCISCSCWDSGGRFHKTAKEATEPNLCWSFLNPALVNVHEPCEHCGEYRSLQVCFCYLLTHVLAYNILLTTGDILFCQTLRCKVVSWCCVIKCRDNLSKQRRFDGILIVV